MAGWSGFDENELNAVTTFRDGTSAQTQTSHIKVEESFMEMEGRGFSDFLRNSSEELFLKSIMESSVGMPAPTMEMLGFRNISNNFRTDSEELFKSWLTNGENNHGYNSTSLPHRPRQPSRRIMTEPSNLSNQQNGSLLLKKKSTDVFSPNVPVITEILNDPNQEPIKNAADKGIQASNLYLAKAWFHSSQPMTRSRSSELRKRYAAMQNSQTYIGIEAMQNAAIQSTSKLKQEFAELNGFGDASTEVPIQFSSFTSPSNSSSSTFNNQQIGNVDKVSSVVNMLKGTLERKKLSNKFDNEVMETSCNGFNFAQDSQVNQSMEYGKGNQFHNIPGMFHEVTPVEMKDNMQFQIVQGNFGCELEGFMAPTNPILLQTVSQEPSQSGSSAATPVISSGFDACDGPSNSCQTKSISESSLKQVGSSRVAENGVKTKDLRERIFDNLKDDKKRGNLVRYGSVTSSAPEDKGDPTKKRRVERSRKMAEAKERNLSPAIPSDMQAILKRCENLEKEVRSLKLNLSFMNRKDSEQTKQIEELQKQNEEMADEKERLLEEIERIISDTGKN